MKRTKKQSTLDVEATPIEPPKSVHKKRKTIPKPLSKNSIIQKDDSNFVVVNDKAILEQEAKVEKKKQSKNVKKVEENSKIAQTISSKKKIVITKTNSIPNKVVIPIVEKNNPLLKPTPTLPKISKIEKPVILETTVTNHSKSSIERKTDIAQKPKSASSNRRKKSKENSNLKKNKEISNSSLQNKSNVEIKPQLVQQQKSNESPALINSEEVNKIRLQEIEQRYGGEQFRKKNRKPITIKPVIVSELKTVEPTENNSHILIVGNPNPNVEDISFNQNETNELDEPKLSYWQQRRLQKKLKQKLQTDSEYTKQDELINSEKSSVVTIESNEVISSYTKAEKPLSDDDIAQKVNNSSKQIEKNEKSDLTSESEPPVLSYWQQRRLNKKAKLLQIREQQNSISSIDNATTIVSEKSIQEPEPQSIGLQNNADNQFTEKLSLKIESQVVTEEEVKDIASTSSLEESPKLSYWQQRRLQRKQKKQQLQNLEVVPSIEENDTSIKSEVPIVTIIESKTSTIELNQNNAPNLAETPETVEAEPRKLSYWQQKRLQKKLKQQQELELKLATQDTESKPEETSIIVPPKRILPFPPEKAILKNENNQLPKTKNHVSTEITSKQLPEKQEDTIVVKEKKILPVPPDKLRQPKPEKSNETAVKKKLPVPADKLLPVKTEQQLSITEKKILPVPAHKVLPIQEKRILPTYEKIDLTKIDSQHVKSQKKNQKPQFPKRPKPPLPTLPEELFSIVQKVEEYIINELNVHSDSTILLGVSGGVDSIAMLDIMAYISLEHNFSIHVAHCNHQLRGNESMEDEKLVRRTASQYGFHFHHTLLKVEEFAVKHKVSTEHAARTLRYQFFEKMAKTTQADLVATAHTADDSAETFLLNLLRGTGLTGLAGIPARRELTRKISIIRPMLTLTKEDLIHYATIRKLHWREDGSNSSLMYKRNKIRLKLLPTLKEQFSPAIIEILNRTARLIHGADKLITEKVEKLIPKLIRSLDKSTVALSIPYFDSVDDFLKGEILQKILIDKFQSQTVSMNTIDRIIALSQSPLGSICDITPTITSTRDRNEIVIQRKEISKEINYTIGKVSDLKTEQFEIKLKEIPRKDVQFTEDPNREFFDADLLPLWLTMRNWKHGDRIQPLGMSGSMTVGDYLTNQKISFIERSKCLVLCAGSEVVWICSLRASDKFKVTATTKRVVSAEFIPISTQNIK